MRQCAGQQLLLGPQTFVLVGGGLHGVDLVDLELQQVDLSGAGAVVAAELAQATVDRRDLGPGLDQCAAVRAGEAVERVALGPRLGERLLCVLSVHLEQRSAELGQACGGGQLARDVRAGPALGGHDPTQHPFLVTDGEESLDDGLGGTGSHP